MVCFSCSLPKEQSNQLFMRLFFDSSHCLIFPDCLKREDACYKLKYLDAMLGGARNRYKDAFSAVKLYLTEAVPLRVFIGYNLAHANSYFSKNGNRVQISGAAVRPQKENKIIQQENPAAPFRKSMSQLKILKETREELHAIMNSEKKQGMSIRELIREGNPTEELFKAVSASVLGQGSVNHFQQI